MAQTMDRWSRSRQLVVLGAVLMSAIGGVIALGYSSWFGASPLAETKRLKYLPRKGIDNSGYTYVVGKVDPWLSNSTLKEISKSWNRVGFRLADSLDQELAKENQGEDAKVAAQLVKAMAFHYEAETIRAYQILEKLRTQVEGNDGLAVDWLYTLIYCQGVSCLRRGEDENCIMCRGESSCILPINQAAIHTNPLGSRKATEHFTEYLREFPDDLEARWLLNLAHMTLGEYPHKVDPQFLVRMDHFDQSEFDIGAFRDIGHVVGVNRLNQAGGAIMEDFHQRGFLDIVTTSWDATAPMAFYRNQGDGAFEDRTKQAGLNDQVGGLNCVQTDYNNDGNMDIFIPRGAWLQYGIRPSLLRNNGNGTFTDVTQEAGLADGMNSACGAWADFDNDGFLDLYFCGERQPSRLFRNKRDGTFEDVTSKSGLPNDTRYCKGCCWIDFDNDGYPDLFLNYFPDPQTNAPRPAELYRNNRKGAFINVTKEMGIDGPHAGFSCWAFDFDNDGWLDIFATSYDRSIKDVVLGLQGKPHGRHSNKLYRNLQGKGFEDVTRAAGLDMVFATMGSNFGDFDNDGYLDMYLGTGDPNLATLVPNRMFKNVAGRRFAEITGSSRTGHLQKGHGVACGDWRRSGNLDIFVETGGAINGDKYHNVLFQNPGQGNNWLNIKLIGAARLGDPVGAKKTNRPALGARIKIITAGETPLTVHRHVTSGSSFGANPLEQLVGLGKANKVATLEIYWPTSGTTQVFRDVDVNQAIEIGELAADYRKLDRKTIAVPK